METPGSNQPIPDRTIHGTFEEDTDSSFEQNVDTSFTNGNDVLPIFDFKSLPVELKNKNLPFIVIGLFLLYRWCT